MFTGIDEVDSYSHPLSAFEHEVAILVEYGGFERNSAPDAARARNCWRDGNNWIFGLAVRTSRVLFPSQRCLRAESGMRTQGKFGREFDGCVMHKGINDIVTVFLSRLQTDPILARDKNFVLS